jgi:hypothetical protein
MLSFTACRNFCLQPRRVAGFLRSEVPARRGVRTQDSWLSARISRGEGDEILGINFPRSPRRWTAADRGPMGRRGWKQTEAALRPATKTPKCLSRYGVTRTAEARGRCRAKPIRDNVRAAVALACEGRGELVHKRKETDGHFTAKQPPRSTIARGSTPVRASRSPAANRPLVACAP